MRKWPACRILSQMLLTYGRLLGLHLESKKPSTLPQVQNALLLLANHITRIVPFDALHQQCVVGGVLMTNSSAYGKCDRVRV